MYSALRAHALIAGKQDRSAFSVSLLLRSVLLTLFHSYRNPSLFVAVITKTCGASEGIDRY